MEYVVQNDQPSMPALLRHARTTYGLAMRAALEAGGFDDVPANGLYLIGGLALNKADVPLGQLIRELRISKQAAGQLVDTLVMRGYLDRVADAGDRRKLTINLTERGKAAAGVQQAARRKIDEDLIGKLGEESVHHARRVLVTLIDMGCPPDHGSAERAPA